MCEIDGLLKAKDTLPEDSHGYDFEVFADAAYRSDAVENAVSRKGLTSQIHERAYRGVPLSLEQKHFNALKSRIRARIEHVFGHVKNAMGGYLIHTVGLARANVKMAFKALSYNMRRFVFLQKRQSACV